MLADWVAVDMQILGNVRRTDSACRKERTMAGSSYTKMHASWRAMCNVQSTYYVMCNTMYVGATNAPVVHLPGTSGSKVEMGEKRDGRTGIGSGTWGKAPRPAEGMRLGQQGTTPGPNVLCFNCFESSN